MILKSINLKEPLIAYVNPHIDEKMCAVLANQHCNTCNGKGSVRRDDAKDMKEIIVCNCVIRRYEKESKKPRI